MKRTVSCIVCLLLCIAISGCASKAKKLLGDIQAKYDNREWAEAITAANELIEKYPNSSEITLAKETLENAKQHLRSEEASSKYEEAVKNYSNGKWSVALSAANELINHYPDSSEAVLAKEIAENAKQQIRLEKASSNYHEALDSYSNGNWDTAIRIAEALKADYPEAPERQYADALIMNCKACKEYAEADSMKMQGDLDGAITSITRLINNYPNADIIDEANTALNHCKEMRANELIDEMEKETDNRNWDRVKSLEKAVIELIPDGEIATKAHSFSAAATIYIEAERKAELMEKLDDAYDKEDWKNLKLYAETLLSEFPQSEESVSAKAFLDKANEELLNKAIEEARAIIRVTKVDFYMNSVGGAELHFNFTNNSDKTINYVHFGVTFYNAVGDIILPKYDREEVNYCTATGPYEKGAGLYGNYWYWGPFYDYTIKTVELVYLSIDYADGSTKTLTKDQIKYVQY